MPCRARRPCVCFLELDEPVVLAASNGTLLIDNGARLHLSGCGTLTPQCLLIGWKTCPAQLNITSIPYDSHLSTSTSDSELPEIVLSIETHCYTLGGSNICEAFRSTDPHCALFLPTVDLPQAWDNTSHPGVQLDEGCLNIDARDVLLSGSSLRTSLAAATCLTCNINHYSRPGGAACSPCPTDTFSLGNTSRCTACRVCEEGSRRTVSQATECSRRLFMTQCGAGLLFR